MRKFSWYAYLVPVMLPMAQVGLTGSIYLTVAISIERYTTVVHPFFKVNSGYHSGPSSCPSYVQLYHSWSSCNYILPVATFSIIYNIPKFLELTTENRTFTEPSNSTKVAFHNQTDFHDLIEKEEEDNVEVNNTVEVFMTA